MRKTKEHDREYFTCKKCQYIVKNPIECGKCRILICIECKGEGEDECPSEGCKDAEFNEIALFVKLNLESLKFVCNNMDLGCIIL